MESLNIPVRISDFGKIRSEEFYYVDKTGLIAELLRAKAEVTLITRPRRFGKTLGMSMLESFFDIRKDSRTLFEGLEIETNPLLCREWMNQWPVIFLSLKNVDGLCFSDAYQQLVYEISCLYQEHAYLLKSPVLSELDKATFKRILERRAEKTEVSRSIQLLSQLMNRYYQKKVILFVDEYDVPVAKANSNGYYYKEMLNVMKSLMHSLQVFLRAQVIW